MNKRRRFKAKRRRAMRRQWARLEPHTTGSFGPRPTIRSNERPGLTIFAGGYYFEFNHDRALVLSDIGDPSTW